MKRIISFILTFCMLMSLTAAFAENDNEIENNENIIDTSLLTDENVLYKAIQEKNGFSLFGLDDSNDEGITTDFDVVMGFDMSYSMYEYDINGDKRWIDSFKSISEQVPEDTRLRYYHQILRVLPTIWIRQYQMYRKRNIQGQTILYLFWTGQLVCLMKNQATGIKLS